MNQALRGSLLLMTIFVSQFSCSLDKPALSHAQRAALHSARLAGAGMGFFGGVVGLDLLMRSVIKNVQEDAVGFFCGSAILSGAGAGSYLSYKTAGAMVNYALAKAHNVSYRVEKVSHYYNVNLREYGSLLEAAEKEDLEAVREKIETVYSERFGKEWRTYMAQLFKEYAVFATQMLEEKRSSLSKDRYDFIRMIEVGAAMGNLYYKTVPSKKNMMVSMVLMYQVLGFM